MSQKVATSRSKVPRVVLLLGALSLSYAAGYASHTTVRADPAEVALPYQYLDTFARVLSLIDARYVDEVDESDLIYGAIKGMIDTLDPHSNFMTPEEHAAMRAQTRGEYVGVGIELGMRDNEITVVSPFEGGPASDAGIQSGDIIAEVDGHSTRGLSIDAVIDLIRGEAGEPVELVMRREADGITDYLTFTLVRDTIHRIAVEYELLPEGFGVISVAGFQLGVTNDVVAAIDDLEVQNDDELRGLVLDLRSNPGGLLSEGIGLADVFLDDGVVVFTEGRDADENESHESHDGSTRYHGPLVVLINSGSASASEIVAGALQDRDRALLIGSTSFGKATVQSIIDFDDGSGLKLTVSRYFTPDHRHIHNVGIDPDIPLTDRDVVPAASDSPYLSVDDALVRAALERMLEDE